MSNVVNGFTEKIRYELVSVKIVRATDTTAFADYKRNAFDTVTGRQWENGLSLGTDFIYTAGRWQFKGDALPQARAFCR